MICHKIDILRRMVVPLAHYMQYLYFIIFTNIYIYILLYFNSYLNKNTNMRNIILYGYRSIFKTSQDWNITLTRREDSFYSEIPVSLKFSRKAFNFYNMIKLSENIVSRDYSWSWYAHKTCDKYFFLLNLISL